MILIMKDTLFLMESTDHCYALIKHHLSKIHNEVCFLSWFSPPVTSPTSSTAEKHGREAKEPPPPPPEFAILLADTDLLELPLEALKVFQADSIASLSRDFSLQMFYHRFFQDNPTGNLHDTSQCNTVLLYRVKTSRKLQWLSLMYTCTTILSLPLRKSINL